MTNGTFQLKSGKRVYVFWIKVNEKWKNNLSRKNNHSPESSQNQWGVAQRWANCVLMTKYEYEYYSISQKWPNTNTNIIWFPKNDEYYSVSQKWPKTNTNIIQLPINDQIQIRISFPFTIMTEYKYNSASPKWSNSINECKFCWASQKESLQDQFWISQIRRVLWWLK